MKKGCVISGGGSRGAFGGGMLQALNNDYHFVVGVSTGSLLSGLTVLGEWDKLKEVYTSVNNDNIYSVNPFNKNNKIRKLNLLWRYAKGETSIGEMCNLRKMMENYFTIDDFNRLKKLNKEVISVSQRLNPKPYKLHFVSSTNVEYEYFLDFLLASSSIPFVANIVKVGTSEYLDGGITEVTPLKYSVEKAKMEGVKHLDVIVHRYDMVDINDDTMGDYDNDPTTDMFDLAIKIWEAHLNEKEIDDIEKGIESAKEHKIDLDIYYLPKRPNMKSHHFDKDIMTDWWESGYNSIKNNTARIQSFRF